MFDPTPIQTYVYTVLCIFFRVQFKGSIDMIDIALKKVDNPLHTELNFLQKSSFYLSRRILNKQQENQDANRALQ